MFGEAERRRKADEVSSNLTMQIFSRPRSIEPRNGFAWLALVIVFVAFAAVVARSPAVGYVAAGCLVLGLIAWPRWINRDIEYFAGAVLITSALLGLPRLIQIGSYSLDAALSIAIVVWAALLLARDSWDIDVAWRWLWPIVLFVGWSYASFLRRPPTSSGLQNVLAYTGFLAIATVTIVRTMSEPRLARTIERLFERVYWLLIAFEAASIIVRGPGAGFLLGPHGTSRSFGLVALLGVAGGLARWRYGDKQRGVAMAASGILLIALSLSRTAFLITCLLIPLSWFSLRSLATFVRMFAITAVAVAVVVASVLFIRPLHDRFFPPTGDFVKVGQYDLNTNGRKLLWSVTWQDYLRSPIVGNGAGASEEAVSLVSQAGHPHNDYLRLLDDYGIVGTALWALGAIVVLGGLIRAWARADGRDDPRSRFFLWAWLAVIAMLLSMVTDNPLVYLHVQGPLALIVGVAIGLAERRSPEGLVSSLAFRPEGTIVREFRPTNGHGGSIVGTDPAR